MVYGVSDLPNLPNRGMETEIFVAQVVCHAQGVRLDESKVLSERKNFEWAGS
jgi:hypothetical protein